MFNLENILRPNVKLLTPYSSARDEFSGSEGIFLDANENPYGMMNRYPDPYQRETKEAIAKLKKVPAENIFLGNGSDEVIDICFRTFCEPGKDKALTFTPTYGMYAVSAAINDVELINVPLNDHFLIDIDKVEPYLKDKNLKLIFICSPNNPSGNLMRPEVVETIINEFNGIIVVDEAYIDFAETESFNQKIAKYPNLIVMQTFSKAYGLASVRVGMAFTSKEIISYFNKMKPPYNVSKPNQEAVMVRIAEEARTKKEVAAVLSERKRVVDELVKIRIIEKVYPSDANFVLAKSVDATLIYDYLVDRKVIVRNRHSVVNNALRITIGTPEENNALIAALNGLADEMIGR
jgi:histidinol-phosphate aminotransferase